MKQRLLVMLANDREEGLRILAGNNAEENNIIFEDEFKNFTYEAGNTILSLCDCASADGKFSAKINGGDNPYIIVAVK